ncbi:MAG: cytochrome c peroxidase, partial [Pseudomonadota bacterium]
DDKTVCTGSFNFTASADRSNDENMIIVQAEIEPVVDADFYSNGTFPEAKVALGQMLFFDKILSGNRNIACATCHHPTLGSSDQLALPLGEGAVGLGKERRVVAEQPVLGRVPRNSQALYFVGAREFERMYHDGRVEIDPNHNWQSGFWSPAREQLPPGLDNVLAVQAMFPVLSPIEMAGHKGENEVATAVALDRLDGPNGAWALIARRLQEIPAYVERFQATYPEIDQPSDITFVHAANAIAAFEAQAFRRDDSPFDRFLRTRNPAELSEAAFRGMNLFYGEAGCAGCHSGKFQTDQQFHAIAMPQIGPGKNDGWDQTYWQETGFAGRLEDVGRQRVTFRPEDAYRFRTPTLRNVELTGPWGHAGSYSSLEEVVRHHLDPAGYLERYRANQAALPPIEHLIERTGIGSRLVFRPVNPNRLDDFLERDSWVQSAAQLRQSIIKANELDPSRLTDAQVDDLIAFLRALTDARPEQAAALVPATVPSGLPVED